MNTETNGRSITLSLNTSEEFNIWFPYIETNVANILTPHS